MMIRVLMAVCLTTCLSAEETPCLSPASDYIVASDLARAVPEFAAAPSGKTLAPAPIVGGKRIFRTEEIRSLAAQTGIKLQPGADVCFAWPLSPLNRNDVLEALRKSLNNSAATIEITDLTTNLVPHGQLEFPLGALSSPASLDEPIPVLWRGDVLYTDTRRFPVWARVRVMAPVNVILAAEKLEAGHPIIAGQLRSETRQRFPTLKSQVTSIEQAIGMIPLRSLSPGTELRLDNLSRPNDVNRGDVVAIEARNGSVKLAFSGRAESAGRTGDLIAVRNPNTQRIFQARICAHDKAIVESDFVNGNGYGNESR